MKCCSQCHERETKKKFWVFMKNRTSDRRILSPNALPKAFWGSNPYECIQFFLRLVLLIRRIMSFFYFLIFSTAMWCCFGVSLIKFVVAYTSVLHFFFFLLSQWLLNCPRHGEFSPNGIDLSKEWHFLFYFAQIFYILPAHKSRIYIT